MLPQFVRDRLRMRDVRLYIRDLLTEYAKLQKFKPQISPTARCMDWQRMLQEFVWPHYKEASAFILFTSVLVFPMFPPARIAREGSACPASAADDAFQHHPRQSGAARGGVWCCRLLLLSQIASEQAARSLRV